MHSISPGGTGGRMSKVTGYSARNTLDNFQALEEKLIDVFPEDRAQRSGSRPLRAEFIIVGKEAGRAFVRCISRI